MGCSISSSSDCSKTSPAPTSLVSTASRKVLLKSRAVSMASKQRRFFTLSNDFDKPLTSDILHPFSVAQSVDQWPFQGTSLNFSYFLEWDSQ